MTRKDFFDTYTALDKKINGLRGELRKAEKECEELMEESSYKFLGIKPNDCIVEKGTGYAWEVFHIGVNEQNMEFYISIEPTADVDYNKTITEREFLEDFVTEDEYNKMAEKQKNENEYQEYIKLKKKFERK